ncbi:bone morphogenetic protein 2-like [Glandiceps talaboti]
MVYLNLKSVSLISRLFIIFCSVPIFPHGNAQSIFHNLPETYKVIRDHIKHSVTACRQATPPCGLESTRYLQNLAFNDSGYVSFNIDPSTSIESGLLSAKLLLHMITEDDDSNELRPLRLTVTFGKVKLLEVSSSNKNDSVTLELDVTTEVRGLLEEFGSSTLDFAISATRRFVAFLVLSLRGEEERHLMVDLMHRVQSLFDHRYRDNPKERFKRRVTRQEVCRQHSLRVDFKELGFSHIIAPHGFTTSICHGVCPFPLDGYLNGTALAALQSLLNARNVDLEGARVPKPSCVPDVTSPLSVIILTGTTFTVTNIPGMIVKSCACH